MIPVVLSGGSGKRLWPISRKSHPKQFCELLDDSLQKKTYQRLQKIGSPWTITVQSLQVLTEKLNQDLNIPLEHILYEPFGKNTAPAIGLLCRVFELENLTKEVVGIFPADHLIENEKEFLNACALAEECAKKGQVATIGIRPSYPATGYGYIEVAQEFAKGQSLTAFQTKGFREKPDKSTAEGFLKSGNFFWNAGMFVFQVSTMIEHFKKYQPKTWKALTELKKDKSNLEEVYNNVEATSIDFGIMEKLDEQVCIPCNFGWNDMGSWDEMAKLNTSKAKVFEKNSSDNYVFSKANKAFALVGVEDLIVVDTADALLIAKKGLSQNVGQIVDAMAKENDLRATEHNYEYRPWGYFEILRDEEHFKAKKIQVFPHQRLSYQSHKKRSEVWTIVRGNPIVTLEDKTHKLSPGDSISIPQGAKHRIQNPNDDLVEFIEIQTGSYFGEDDIVRHEDDYRRV